MKLNFTPSLVLVLVHEGGYVDDPRDPGGRTNHGVTQAVYDDYRTGHKLPKQSVRNISDVEVEAIYYLEYWSRLRADQLPVGVDYCAFDLAVNSGVNRAGRYLQRAVGVAEDGSIGPATLAAVGSKSAVVVIDQVCAYRLSFLKQLPIFDRFGHGWTVRVEEVCAKAKEMAA